MQAEAKRKRPPASDNASGPKANKHDSSSNDYRKRPTRLATRRPVYRQIVEPDCDQLLDAEDRNALMRYQWLLWSEQGPRKTSQRAICQVLVAYRLRYRHVYPSEEQIGIQIGADARTVSRNLPDLERDGWLIVQRVICGRGHSRNVYHLRFPHHVDRHEDGWLIQAEDNRQEGLSRYNDERGYG
jgi:hypothetical protein